MIRFPSFVLFSLFCLTGAPSGYGQDIQPDLIPTPYDAEALINLHDSLYIFTKNHTGIRSDIYPVTKKPGTYVLHKSDSINTDGLITGAAYDGESNSILLTGYNQLSAFIIEVKETTTMSFSTSNKIYLILEGSEQVESIYPMGKGSYLITSEGNQLNWPALLRFRLNTVTSTPPNSETDLHIYPNPATTTANIPCPGTYEVEIISMSGLEVSLGKAGITDVSSFKPGSYLIRVKDEAGKFIMTEKLIIR